tara:strand:- start:252 stop:449 length:198 start_codon:yes stop_codon:yes gene_type:complete
LEPSTQLGLLGLLRCRSLLLPYEPFGGFHLLPQRRGGLAHLGTEWFVRLLQSLWEQAFVPSCVVE